MNFNNNSFSIDSNQNNSSNPFKPKIPQLDSNPLNGPKNNENDYQLSPSLLTYKFRNAQELQHNSLINKKRQQGPNQINLNNQKKIANEQNSIFKKTFSRFAQNQNKQIETNINKSKGLLKQSMKVQYQFDGIKSQIINSYRKLQSYQRPVKSQITKNRSQILSANIFSCMDTPDYQRDFQVSPKVLSRR